MTELDVETLRRCRRGDPAALGVLYDCYRRPVYYLARRMVGEAEAEDVCQETFIAVFRAVVKFEGKSKLSTWVLAVATRVCLMHLRKRRRQEASAEPADTAETEPMTLLSPSHELLNKEFLKRLADAMDRLPENQRLAVSLRSFEEMSYEEIARAMNCRLEQVRAMLFRARCRLLKLLEGH
ncbi:MAG: sigma-70 family RNA polymerase sigma factor [Verrucomicrobia bacterium]|nr:sigma-70 family RNA polymerase sigma factor [Verrucomicrobiota bacterium]